MPTLYEKQIIWDKDQFISEMTCVRSMGLFQSETRISIHIVDILKWQVPGSPVQLLMILSMTRLSPIVLPWPLASCDTVRCCMCHRKEVEVTLVFWKGCSSVAFNQETNLLPPGDNPRLGVLTDYSHFNTHLYKFTQEPAAQRQQALQVIPFLTWKSLHVWKS